MFQNDACDIPLFVIYYYLLYSYLYDTKRFKITNILNLSNSTKTLHFYWFTKIYGPINFVYDLFHILNMALDFTY